MYAYWHIIMMRNLPSILFIHRKWVAPIVVKVQRGGHKINVNKRLNHLNFILKESSLYLPNLPIPSWYYYSKSNKLILSSFQSTVGHFESKRWKKYWLSFLKGSLNAKIMAFLTNLDDSSKNFQFFFGKLSKLQF